jgi:DNA-binding CsgD family transcriptional regulator
MRQAVAPLVGREEELAMLDRFISDVEEGSATFLLEGEAGIGKTSLWWAGVTRAQELGFRVLEARAAAAESELSFAGLGDLLSDVHDEIGHLPAPQRRALRIALVLEEIDGDPPEPRAIAAAVLALLRRLAHDSPLLVALDDVHWLDPPTEAALLYALRRLEGEPVRTLATVRSGGSSIRPRGADLLTIGPLELSALDRLIRERLGVRFLRPTLRQLEEVSRGNPFYALEIAGSLLRSRARVEPGDSLPIPPTLRELVDERLAMLSPAAREAALATAALAQPTVEIVGQALAERPDGVVEAIDAGILERGEGDTLVFTHPLLAISIYETTSPAQRVALHRRLAELVSEPEERARHLAESAEGPDEELATALESAAQSAAARGAPDAGARLAKRAYELTPRDRWPQVHRRHLLWAQFTSAAGDPKAAERLLVRQLRSSPPGRERAEVEFELGKVRLATRGVSEARGCFERALALNKLEKGDEVALRAEILIQLAEMHARDLQMSSTASEQAVALAETIGRRDLLARALGVHGLTLMVRGQRPSDEYWRRAFRIERSTGELRYGGPTWAYTFIAFARGDFATAAECERRVAESMRRRGDPMLPTELLGMCEIARISGDWDAAALFADEAYELVVQTGRESEEPGCLLSRARIAHPRGDLDLARQDAEAALALVGHLQQSDPHRLDVQATAQAIFAQIAWISGRYAEAHQWSTSSIEAVRRLGPVFEHFLAESYAGDIESLLALGELEQAAQQLERLLEMTRPLSLPTLDALADRTRGMLTAAEGDNETALDLLERARQKFDELPGQWPFQLARTLLALGEVRRRARQKRAAREALEHALEMFDRLGAPLWAAKARAELALLGGRPTRSGALTATEQRVADLVAAGHSNAEVAHELFVSPKTVEWNLSKIYKKLHVRSRTELAAKLARKQAVSI